MPQHRRSALNFARNPRPHRAYGFGPVEQIVMTINIGLRRQAAQLQHFTDGNVPPGLLTAPDGWSGAKYQAFKEARNAAPVKAVTIIR